jgi:hydrogenase expression/formation protein HypE
VADIDISIYDEYLPVRPDVSAACRILGMDPLYIANEGIMLLSVPDLYAQKTLAALSSTEIGKNAAIIGEVRNGSGNVFAVTPFGIKKKIFLPRGELLPRIC